MLTKAEAEARVAKGAAILDETAPGWASKINVGTLRMASHDCCICGQISGGHGWAAGLPYAFKGAVAHLPGAYQEAGFAIYENEERGSYAFLQDAWIMAIADRLVPDAPEPNEAVAENVAATRCLIE